VNLVVSAVLGTLFLCAWLLRRPPHGVRLVCLQLCLLGAVHRQYAADRGLALPDTMTMARANLLLFVLFCGSYCITWRFGEQQLPRLERALWALTGLGCAYALLAPVAWLPTRHP
jgi:hypothetical protein